MKKLYTIKALFAIAIMFFMANDAFAERWALSSTPWTLTATVEGANATTVLNENHVPAGITLFVPDVTNNRWRWRTGANDGMDPNGTDGTMTFSAEFIQASTSITFYVGGVHSANVVDVDRLVAIWPLEAGQITINNGSPFRVGSGERNTVTIDVSTRTTELVLPWPWGASNGATAPGRLNIFSINRTTAGGGDNGGGTPDPGPDPGPQPQLIGRVLTTTTPTTTAATTVAAGAAWSTVFEPLGVTFYNLDFTTEGGTMRLRGPVGEQLDANGTGRVVTSTESFQGPIRVVMSVRTPSAGNNMPDNILSVRHGTMTEGAETFTNAFVTRTFDFDHTHYGPISFDWPWFAAGPPVVAFPEGNQAGGQLRLNEIRIYSLPTVAVGDYAIFTAFTAAGTPVTIPTAAPFDMAGTVPFATDITAVPITFVAPGSEVRVNGVDTVISSPITLDFTSPRTFTVSGDGLTTTIYEVTIERGAANDEAEFLTFRVNDTVIAVGNLDNGTFPLPFLTNFDEVVVTFTTSVGAVVRADGTVITSPATIPITPGTPVVFAVTSEDGLTTVNHTATFTRIAPAAGHELLTFAVSGMQITPAAAMTQVVPHNTRQIMLSFTTSPLAVVTIGSETVTSGSWRHVSPTGAIAPITFRVTAETGDFTEHTVSFTRATAPTATTPSARVSIRGTQATLITVPPTMSFADSIYTLDTLYFESAIGGFNTSDNLCGQGARIQIQGGSNNAAFVIRLGSTSAGEIQAFGNSTSGAGERRTVTSVETGPSPTGPWTAASDASWTMQQWEDPILPVPVGSNSGCWSWTISGLNAPQGSYVRVVLSNNFRFSHLDIFPAADGGETSIDDLTPVRVEESITFYPNPVFDVLNVVGENLRTIEIINMMGNVVLSTPASGNTHALDVSGLASGLHFIRVTTETGITVGRFIKQ